MSRFSEPQHPDFQRLNASIAFDRRLWPQDIAQSRAHARMLAARGVISEADAEALLGGLAAVERELRDGSFAFEPDDEDIHTAVERRLTEIVGRVGGRLHTARSRNDQVATDLSMFTRAEAAAVRERLRGLMATFLTRAEEHLDWPMPGYTHLQRAQPVYLSHHLLAYLWMLQRDRARFAFTEDQAGVLPLGAGALAGVNFDTDRRQVADELHFHTVAPNSIDAVANRDFVLDFLAAAATCTTHLSRLGAELVLWSSEEFGFCELPDAWTSGSSIMPQKKNPDAAELLRAKAPRVAGHLLGFQGVMHALPLTYNKDLQEDKEHLFDVVDTLELVISAAQGMLQGVRFRRERLQAAAADEMIAATDVADLLVRRGVPFREAHGVVAGLVRTAVDSGRPLSALSREELAAHSDVLDDEFYAVLSQRSWLESKTSEGGTSLARVREQIELARAAVGVAPLSTARPLPHKFYARPVLEVARDLLGCVVEREGVSGLIVETEAYHETEPACHAFVGRTARTRTLFGPPGHVYMYRSYGIHAMLNLVCEPEGSAAAVLIRALQPRTGIELMRERRGRVGEHELCSGPGKLAQALAIPLSDNGADLSVGPVLVRPRPADWSLGPVAVGVRVGITKAMDLPWRFAVAGHPDVSRPRPVFAAVSPA